MEEQEKFSLEQVSEEYNVLKRKYELQYELDSLQILLKDKLDWDKKRRLEADRFQLLEMDFDDLVQKLDLESQNLKKNLNLLKERKNERVEWLVLIGLVISCTIGALAICLLILPFVNHILEVPQIVVSISIITLFVSSIWIYKSWNKFLILKYKKNIINKKITESEELYRYCTDVLRNISKSSNSGLLEQ